MCLSCHRAKHARRREKNWQHSASKSQLERERHLRLEASRRGMRRYQSVISCKNGHNGERYTKCRSCVECARRKSKERYWESPEEASAGRNHRRRMNLSRERLRDRKYYKRNRDVRSRKHVDLRRRKRQSDPVYAMKHRVRSLINHALAARGFKKSTRTASILGCTWLEFKEHIERQFLPGMSWENRSRWHIDHIVPMATAKTIQEAVALCHVSNLRPLWADENQAKGDSVLFLL